MSTSRTPFASQNREEGSGLFWGGIVLIVGSLVGSIPAGLLLIPLLLEIPWLKFIAGSVVSAGIAAGTAAGISLIVSSRSHFARPAEELLAEDPRPPVLFLRQFSDDGIVHEGDDTERGHYVRRSFEERIERALRAIGPVVAIGRPGDVLPPPGAARFYVANDDWQEKVSELIDRSALIALQIGDTPGIRWEVDQVVARVNPSRAILILPLQASGLGLDRDRYQRFVANAGDLFPKSLPSDPPAGTRFILFDNDWTPQLLNATALHLGPKAHHPRSAAAVRLLGEFRPVPMFLRLHYLVPLVFLGALGLLEGWQQAAKVAKEVHQSTWFGFYQSEAGVLDAARPHLATMAENLREIAAHLPVAAIQPAPLDPQLIYGPPEARPNTDILTVSQVEGLARSVSYDRQSHVRDERTRDLSRYLVWALDRVHKRDREASNRRPRPQDERDLALATGLEFVVIVARGSIDLVPITAPNTWQASEAMQLSVVRLRDRKIVAATALSLSATFAFEDSEESSSGSSNLEQAQRILKRLKIRREGPEGRELFARAVLWRSAQQRIPEVLELLTGGRFTDSAI